MKRELKPDFEFLKERKIFHYFQKPKLKFEIDECYINSLKPFLKEFGGRDKIHELFFYQLNRINPPKNEILIQWRSTREEFESMVKLWQLLENSKINGIRLYFENGQSADIPPNFNKVNGKFLPWQKDRIDLLGEYLKEQLYDEKPDDIIDTYGLPAEKSPAQKIQEFKANEKELETTRLLIKRASKDVESILNFNSTDAILDEKRATLITYALFYQKGHRLNFRKKEDEKAQNLLKEEIEKNLSQEEKAQNLSEAEKAQIVSDRNFLKIIQETTNPLELKSFDDERILNNLRRA